MTLAPQFWWHLSRASGFVSWILLTASLLWGVLLFTRALKHVDRPSWLLEMHIWLSGLAIVTMIVHLVALVFDNYLVFSWKEILVPGGSPWKTVPVAFGVVAFWLLMTIQITASLRKFLPRKLWKSLHLLSYAAWWMVSLHAGLAGTDVTHRAYQAVALALTAAAISATFLRVVAPRRRGRVDNL